jgi:hypothetical protein
VASAIFLPPILASEGIKANWRSQTPSLPLFARLAPHSSRVTPRRRSSLSWSRQSSDSRVRAPPPSKYMSLSRFLRLRSRNPLSQLVFPDSNIADTRGIRMERLSSHPCSANSKVRPRTRWMLTLRYRTKCHTHQTTTQTLHSVT